MARYHGPTSLYRLFDAESRLLYVGITNSPTGRFTAHACEKVWWDEIATITLQHFPSRREAERAEEAAILSERPVFNAAHNEANPARQPNAHRPWVLPRGRCAYCGDTMAVYQSGIVSRHHTGNRADGTSVRYGPCPGSLKPPSEVHA